MKVLTQTGLTELITKIKAWGNAVFLKRAEVEQATTIDIDTVPTTDSSNLITSGGVKTALDGKGTYTKPDSGIPKTDLASDVQTSLGKADTALQTHQSLAAYRTASAQDVIDNTKETTANKTAILSSESTDTQYPTAKVVYDNVSTKSTVTASTTGTTATEAKFLTIDGVEWKLADSGSSTDTNAVHYLAETKTAEQQAIARTNIGAESSANKVTTITSASTDTQYPSAKAVFDTEQDIKEIAEGKTKTYVISKATNPSFDTQDATITITTFTTIDSVVHQASELKLGDNIYIQEIDVPDRWCSITGSTATLCKLETAKVPVTDVQKNGVSVVTNTVANIAVPTKTSDIVNDSGFLTQHQDISGKEDKTNKVTSMSASSTDTQYPSAKAVYDAIQSIPAGYESVTIDTSITTMAQLAAKVDEINTAGRHAFFDMHNQITGAYVCLVQKYTESTVDFMFIFDLLNRHVYGSLVGYSGTTLISDYIAASGNNNDLPYVLRITDINTTLATMITLIDQVNALGQHVLIDVSALNTKDYLITFSYKTGASVTACKAIGLVNGTEAYKGYTTADLSTTLLSTFLNTAGDLSSYFVGTYAELKLLKDNSLLIPGAKYRLTDYELTANSMLTSYVNGNHPFDLILTADTSTSFNERCAAARHAGDTYYANCDLSQWVVDYQFENNNAIHRWCDTSANGKGCIYGLKDERNNFCSWDFKNLAFWAGNIKSNYVNSSKNNSRSYTTVLYTMGGETDLSVQYGKSSLSNFNMCNLHFYDPDAAWPFVILLDTTNARSVNLRSTGNVWSPNNWPHYTLNCTGSIQDVDINFDSAFEFFASTFINVTGTAERIYNSVLSMSWVNLDQVNLSNSNCNIQYSQISGTADIRFTAASPNMRAANEAPTVIFANKRIKGYIGEPLYCVSNSTDVGFDISGQTFVELTTTASKRFTAEWRDGSGLLNTVYCNSSSIPLTYSTIPTFPIKISTSLAWDKEIRAGSTTPAITLPSPKTSASYVETMSYIFTAATTTASFTAPANYIMTDTTFTGMSTTGNTITLNNLETGHLYIVKFKVVSSNQIIMETEDWGALSV